MHDLNKFEFSILERLATKYPFVKEHLPFLKVEGREKTGVGMYVNFTYNNPPKELRAKIGDASISTNETIGIDGLKYGLGYEVDISDGRLKFMELFTYGEEWNGITGDHFTFETGTPRK